MMVLYVKQNQQGNIQICKFIGLETA